MGNRVIPQREARATQRALRAWLFAHFDRKASAAAHRYWHLGTVKLDEMHQGVLEGMREMARDSEYGVVLLGDLVFEDGATIVRVYAMAMPHDGMREVRDDA